MSEKIKIGITQGDINGIGLEVIMKTFADPAMLEICTPVLFGSQKTYLAHKKALNIDMRYTPIKGADQIGYKQFNIVTIYEEEAVIEFGQSTPQAGKYALQSIEAACDALEKNLIDAMVTAPINKHNIQSEQFPFKGHTEYFEMRFKSNALMLMCSDSFRVGMVTGHIPLANVAAGITQEKIIQKAKQLNQSLMVDFGIRKPKMAVLGMNPHAGDNGVLGNEETNIIQPAIEKLKAEGLVVFGPYPADGFFGSATQLKFDGVLAMYHDQGLAPFKALAFDNGVNFTAGLPVIRTSPDHGVGYDIAGKNKANEESFRAAVYLACDVYQARKQQKEITANPLKTYSKAERE
jgi:4-hydroxythreonine-4-phosphate dehydrogenase